MRDIAFAMNRIGGIAYRVLPFACAVALFPLMRANPYWRAATWALVLYVSILGWGALVARLVGARTRPDLGLRASWGIAATLMIGGIAVMLHIASRPFLIAQIAVGVLLAVGLRALDRDRLPSRRSLAATLSHVAPYLVVFGCAFGVCIEWLGQLATPPNNVSDDQGLYFFLAEKVVQTGSLFDPFDVRRITSYGGQFYLHAQFLVVGSHYQLNVVDAGIGTLVVFTNIIGMVAPRSLRRADAALLGLLLVMLLTIGQVRYNIGSLLTGVAMGLGTYRTLLWIDDTARLSIKRLALLAACTVATCTLRTSNAVPIIAFVGCAILARPTLIARRLTKQTLFDGLRDAVTLGALYCAVIFPWLITFRESSGTLIYPLGRGNITPGFVLLKMEPGIVYNLKHLVGDLGHDRPLIASLLLLLAGLAPMSTRKRGWVQLASVVCFMGMFLISYTGGGFDDSINSRYYFAFLLWTAIIVAASATGRGSVLSTSRGVIVAAAIVAQIVTSHDETRKRIFTEIDASEHAVTNAAAEFEADQFRTQEYRDVQYRLPVGAKIAVAVADPFRFDMKRNTIFSLDQPGGMGPDGGFPTFRGPESFAEYLARHGVRYFIAMNFHTSHELYDIDRWRRHKLLEHSFLAYEAPIQVDAMESIEALEHSRRVVYHQFDMSAVDMATRAE